jgi:hypothetical protein
VIFVVFGDGELAYPIKGYLRLRNLNEGVMGIAHRKSGGGS